MSKQSNNGEREEAQRRLPEETPTTSSPSMSSLDPPFPTAPTCAATENSHLTSNEEFETYFDNERIHIPESENVRIIYAVFNVDLAGDCHVELSSRSDDRICI